VNEKHFQIACQKYFEFTHPNATVEGGIQHPNHYYEESENVYLGRARKARVAGKDWLKSYRKETSPHILLITKIIILSVPTTKVSLYESQNSGGASTLEEDPQGEWDAFQNGEKDPNWALLEEAFSTDSKRSTDIELSTASGTSPSGEYVSSASPATDPATASSKSSTDTDIELSTASGASPLGEYETNASPASDPAAASSQSPPDIEFSTSSGTSPSGEYEANASPASDPDPVAASSESYTDIELSTASGGTFPSVEYEASASAASASTQEETPMEVEPTN